MSIHFYRDLNGFVGERERRDYEREFRAEADTIEAICDWLETVWDQSSEDATADMVLDATLVRRDLERALAPHRDAILRHTRAMRRKRGAPSPLTLFDVTMEARR